MKRTTHFSSPPQNLSEFSQSPQDDACLVLVTCGNSVDAEALAKILVTEHLAACVNLIGAGNPVQSFYIWEGKLQQEAEVLLLIKSVESRLEPLEKRILECHAYQTPEFIVIPLIGGSAAYLDWLFQTVNP